MRELEIDIETYSSVPIGTCGVYKYVESPDFEIILFGYAVDGSEVQVVDLLQGEKIPEEIMNAIKDDKVIKLAHNASFERICLSKYFNIKYLSPASWHCTMIWAAYLSLPFSLSSVGEVLGIDRKKLEEGKELVRYFCVPCTPTKSNNQRTRNLPHHAPEKWELFKRYNKRDVEAEMDIKKKLEKYPVPDFVWDEYHLDQEINDRGISVDEKLVDEAIRMDGEIKNELVEKMKELTALENPNSVSQLRKWLSIEGIDVESLGKKDVKAMLDKVPEKIRYPLTLRLQLAKSSIKKYQAMKNSICEDGRCHGMFQFYGANHTGRWAGRIVQLQNLPQNHLPDLEETRALIRSGDLETAKVLFDDIPDTLSQLIRTAFLSPTTYLVADYSAIECRVIAWLAGEQWVLDAFAQGKDIYCATAEQMFHVPVEKHGQNSELRQKGKQATLSCGYGGGPNAMIAMGALSSGMKEEELQPLVNAWRAANPNIVRFWWNVDKMAKKAIKEKTTTKVGNIIFSYQSAILFITLPSGRKLVYMKPRIEENRFGGESISYEGIGEVKKWVRLETYGPKIVENIVQATSRDILANAMKNLRNSKIVAHVHDELIIEKTNETLEEVERKMAELPPWADGLILRADGYETKFYKKD